MISFTPSWKCAAHLSSVHSRRVGIFSGESCSICVSLPYVLVYRCATMLKEMYWNVSHSVPMYFVSVCMCKCLSENGHSSSLQELGQIMWHNASLFPSFLCPFRYFCHFFISFTVASQTGVQILTVLKKVISGWPLTHQRWILWFSLYSSMFGIGTRLDFLVEKKKMLPCVCAAVKKASSACQAICIEPFPVLLCCSFRFICGGKVTWQVSDIGRLHKQVLRLLLFTDWAHFTFTVDFNLYQIKQRTTNAWCAVAQARPYKWISS